MKTNEIKCCTPNGQIKRYKDCIGCDRNPLELNQNKMTAVEWLKMKMATSPKEEMIENINVWFAKAKEMEKEQIKDAYDEGAEEWCDGFYVVDISSESYYNKTFKS